MFYRRFFPLSFLLSWEHNWSVLFSSFVLGFRRNMGSVPRGCNSRCFCVRGICGSAAQNPQDKDSRYGKETRNPEKKLKPFKFNIRWHEKQEGRLNCKKKEKKDYVQKRQTPHQRGSLPTVYLLLCSGAMFSTSILPYNQSEMKTDW